MVLLHLACFISLIMFIGRQEAYVTNISSLGESGFRISNFDPGACVPARGWLFLKQKLIETAAGGVRHRHLFAG